MRIMVKLAKRLFPIRPLRRNATRVVLFLSTIFIFISCTSAPFAGTSTYMPLLNASLMPYRQAGVESILSCDGTSCQLENACVRHDGLIHVYGMNTTVHRIISLINSFRVRLYGDKRYYAVIAGESIVPSLLSERAVLMDRYVENCGHILGDEVWATFRLALRYEGLPETMRRGVGHVLLNHSKLFSCDESFFALSQTVLSATLNRTTRCYKHIRFGVSGMSYAEGYEHNSRSYLRSMNFTRDMRGFRDKFYNYVGVRSLVANKVLIMVKKKGEHLVNMDNLDQLTALLSEELPSYVVMHVSWSDYTIPEQIALLRQSKLMISLPGADVLNGVFLPDNSHVIIFCRYVNGVVELSNEKALWLDHLRYINCYEFCGSDALLQENGNVLVNVSRARQILWRIRNEDIPSHSETVLGGLPALSGY